jgi:electron transport complex protein RnfC
MQIQADILPTAKLTFSHGIHPQGYKYLSSTSPIERMPFARHYIIPLGQHIGAPASPVVRKGERVKRGQKIADPVGFVSVALHSPVDGTVVEIGLFAHPGGREMQAIKIATDPFSQQIFSAAELPDLESMDEKAFIAAVQESGLVGLGGAAFPAHVKFAIPEGKTCKYLMINGAECEPFLTADDRIMVEHADAVLDGVAILNRYIKAEKVFIAIEANKPEAILAVGKAAASSDQAVEVVPLKVKYPQGAEKMMITAILGVEVPSGKLPIDMGILVSNVGSIVALSEYFRTGKPLIERVVTITGTAVKRPTNVLVPIGTSMQELVDWCGGLTDELARILLGGPMMGMVQKSLDVPVVKGTSGILALTNNEVKDLDEYNCIKCGRCVDACPLFLNPSRMGLLAKKGLWEEMMDEHVLDCFECASCSYVCPSNIPLVQSFRVAKGFIREQKAREN